MQKIKAEVVITIPDDMVIITRVEYEQLKQNELHGIYWSMKELEKRVNKKSEWIKENILYPLKFRKILDSKNEGVYITPKQKDKRGLFKQLIWQNFQSIFS